LQPAFSSTFKLGKLAAPAADHGTSGHVPGSQQAAVYAMQARGVIPTVRSDGRVMFDVQDLDRHIEENKNGKE
jgi:hypothetical protein